ncbi:short-chain dehydrogenase [Aspergillus costaricaensis CBS 115574]|uniref:Short-chain dehydrogenase n=1 Tax=Aspergillus costaricaensis CBS 115574 TaxID=1448317 RepID=A0ACD1IHY5_9EURO|nr:short-chain dehydrogenase [Aspergillus costaricaensis CBS 115574]RAK89369.1 short-chain dehydrogenase [Aspergillus costaricaensis CBS 115574]
MTRTWVIVGASRGIGLEFVRQLASSGERVIAAVRSLSSAEQLFELLSQYTRNGAPLITVEECDVTKPDSIDDFSHNVQKAVRDGGLRLTNVILNAGINQYPNRATEISFQSFTHHLQTNTIGPIIVAQRMLSIDPTTPLEKIIFISSDSGSASQFRSHEDGFAVYAATKAALNQSLRHMAAEISRKGVRTCVLALHPGEVETDMANMQLEWIVEGVIQPRESVEGMLRVIKEKGEGDNGSFWCWDGRSHPW